MFEMSDLGKRMKNIRKHMNKTQTDVAEHMDISVNMYSLLERGERKLNLDHIIAYAKYFDISLSDFFMECDDALLIEVLTRNISDTIRKETELEVDWMLMDDLEY